MDPTAIFFAVGQFFAFMTTPAGQNVANDIRNLNQKFNEDVAKLVSTMASHAPAAPTPPQTAASQGAGGQPMKTS